MLCAIPFFFLSLLLLVLSNSIFATTLVSHSAVAGYWQTIDPETNIPSSVIRVKRVGTSYEGSIAKIYVENHHRATDICHACKGRQKNKPMLGLTIITRMKCSVYACHDGKILDPRDGKLYHASMMLINNGKQLKVRGYIGIPLFGRTVVWNRLSHI